MPKYLRVYEWLYKRLIREAHKRGWRVEFSYEEFLPLTEIECCRYCNGPIVWHKHTTNRNAGTNLDRKDNTKNYTLDNIAICCHTCNTRKSNWLSDDEFQLVQDMLRVWRSLSATEKLQFECDILSYKDA